MRLNEAIRQFLEGYFATHDRSQKTKKAYELDLRQFQAFLGSGKSLKDVTPEALEKWAAHLRNLNYKPASIRRKFASIKVLVRYWLRKGPLDASPFDRVKLEFGKAKTLPKHLTESQSRRLLARAIEEAQNEEDTARGPRSSAFRAQRNRAIVEVLLLTGMRVGELTSLRLTDWREDDQVLKVRGKGDRERVAPVSSSEGLTSYLRRRESVSTPHKQMFISPHGSPLTTQSVASMLSGLSRRAGIQKRVTPHMLRHTAATLLLENGADIRVVQRLLGHASIVTTQKYTHVTSRLLMGQLARFHPLIAARTPSR